MKPTRKEMAAKPQKAEAKKVPAKAPPMHPAAKNLGRWLHPKKGTAEKRK